MVATAANQSSTVVLADTVALFIMVKNVATKSRRPIAHLRVATDCSGIDVPMAVFEQLDITTDHVFSSESNQTLREFIAERFAPQKIYNDMKSRNNDIPCPEETDLDVYAAGLPCQPFSKSGKNLGVADAKDGGRGILFYYALHFIRHRTPKAFLLENVENLTTQHKETWDAWLNDLRRDGLYNVQWTILDTKDHGIPQRRRRLYIVGIKKDIEKQPFVFPDPVACLPLELFLDIHAGPSGWLTQPSNNNKTHARNIRRGLEEMLDKRCDPRTYPAMIDHGATRGPVAYRVCPTMTACRMRGGGFWLLHKGRQMTYNEMLRLQGLPPTRFKPVAGARQSQKNQMKHAVGNAMSGNVLHRVMARIAHSLGVPAKDEWADPLQACVKLL